MKNTLILFLFIVLFSCSEKTVTNEDKARQSMTDYIKLNIDKNSRLDSISKPKLKALLQIDALELKYNSIQSNAEKQLSLVKDLQKELELLLTLEDESLISIKKKDLAKEIELLQSMLKSRDIVYEDIKKSENKKSDYYLANATAYFNYKGMAKEMEVSIPLNKSFTVIDPQDIK